jgi:hypothetical protein
VGRDEEVMMNKNKSMNNTSQGNKNIIANSLRLIKECPVCHTRYTQTKVQVIDMGEKSVLVYFTCAVCYTSLLATIIELPFGIIGSAMVTDLKAPEVKKFMSGEEVTEDDVLAVYEMLEGRKSNSYKAG